MSKCQEEKRVAVRWKFFKERKKICGRPSVGKAVAGEVILLVICIEVLDVETVNELAEIVLESDLVPVAFGFCHVHTEVVWDIDVASHLAPALQLLLELVWCHPGEFL